MKSTKSFVPRGLHDAGNGAETTHPVHTMARSPLKCKRLSNSITPANSKRMKPSLPWVEPSQHSLVRVVQQYGLLRSIVAHLNPEDLFALALSAKVLYHAIVPRPKSIENLLGRMQCPGRGVQIRKRCHQKSVFFSMFGCTEYVICASKATDRAVDARPCVECKITTCNECRIHCVYQSIYEKPFAEDELPNFSGFVMLNATEVPILSPHHLPSDHPVSEPQWQDPSTNNTGPYHDSGSIDSPMEESAYGPPEEVNHILDLDLGQTSLAFSSYSNVADPSPVLKVLHKITEQRKRWFCDEYFPGHTSSGEALRRKPCSCTLRGRYLDRWLCLRCYEKEEESLAKYWPEHMDKCACGKQNEQAVCTWCWGTVMVPGVGQSPTLNSPDA